MSFKVSFDEADLTYIVSDGVGTKTFTQASLSQAIIADLVIKGLKHALDSRIDPPNDTERAFNWLQNALRTGNPKPPIVRVATPFESALGNIFEISVAEVREKVARMGKDELKLLRSNPTVLATVATIASRPEAKSALEAFRGV